MKRELESTSSTLNITGDEKPPKSKFRKILFDLLKNSMNKLKNVSESSNTVQIHEDVNNEIFVDINEILQKVYAYTMNGHMLRVDKTNEYIADNFIKIDDREYKVKNFYEVISRYIMTFDSSDGKNPGLDIVVTKTQKLKMKDDQRYQLWVITLTFFSIKEYVGENRSRKAQIVILIEFEPNKLISNKYSMFVPCDIFRIKSHLTSSDVPEYGDGDSIGSDLIEINVEYLLRSHMVESKQIWDNFNISDPIYTIASWPSSYNATFSDIYTNYKNLKVIGRNYPSKSGKIFDEPNIKIDEEEMEVDTEPVMPKKVDRDKTPSPTPVGEEHETEFYTPVGDDFFTKKISISDKLDIMESTYIEYAKMIKKKVKDKMNTFVPIPGSVDAIFLFSSAIRFLYGEMTILDSIVILSYFIDGKTTDLPKDIILDYISYSKTHPVSNYEKSFSGIPKEFFDKINLKFDDKTKQKRVEFIHKSRLYGSFTTFIKGMIFSRYGYDVFYHKKSKKQKYEYDSVPNIMYYLIEYHRFIISNDNAESRIIYDSLFCTLISYIFSSKLNTGDKASSYNEISQNLFNKHKNAMKQKTIAEFQNILFSPNILFFSDDPDKKKEASMQLDNKLTLINKSVDGTEPPSVKIVKGGVSMIKLLNNWIDLSEYRGFEDKTKEQKKVTEIKRLDVDIKPQNVSKTKPVNPPKSSSQDSSSKSQTVIDLSKKKESQTKKVVVNIPKFEPEETKVEKSILFEHHVSMDIKSDTDLFLSTLSDLKVIYSSMSSQIAAKNFPIGTGIMLPYVMKHKLELPLFSDIFLLWTSFLDDSFNVAPFMLKHISLFIRDNNRDDLKIYSNEKIDLKRTFKNDMFKYTSDGDSFVKMNSLVIEFINSDIYKGYIKPTLLSFRGYLCLLSIFRDSPENKIAIMDSIMEFLQYCFDNHKVLKSHLTDKNLIEKFFTLIKIENLDINDGNSGKTKIISLLQNDIKKFYDDKNMYDRQLYVMNLMRFFVSPYVIYFKECSGPVLQLHHYVKPFLPSNSAYSPHSLAVDIRHFEKLAEILNKCENIQLNINEGDLEIQHIYDISASDMENNYDVVLVPKFQEKIKTYLNGILQTGEDLSEDVTNFIIKFAELTQDGINKFDPEYIEYLQSLLLDMGSKINILEENDLTFAKEFQEEYPATEDIKKKESVEKHYQNVGKEKKKKQKKNTSAFTDESFYEDVTLILPEKVKSGLIESQKGVQIVAYIEDFIKRHKGTLSIQKKHNLSTAERFPGAGLDIKIGGIMLYYYMEPNVFDFVREYFNNPIDRDYLQDLDNIRKELLQ